MGEAKPARRNALVQGFKTSLGGGLAIGLALLLAHMTEAGTAGTIVLAALCGFIGVVLTLPGVSTARVLRGTAGVMTAYNAPRGLRGQILDATMSESAESEPHSGLRFIGLAGGAIIFALVVGAIVVVRTSPSPESPRGPVEPMPPEERATVAAPDLPKVEAAVPESDARKEFTNSIGMKLTLIAPGEFLMGSPDSEAGAARDERPQHPVRITRPFYLGVYEVTQQEYESLMGPSLSWFAKGGGGKERVAGQDTRQYPVENLTWIEAIEFCNKLSVREGLKPYYQFAADKRSGGDGYRLPTEAEWEYACRAGTTTQYSFGDDPASVEEYAWCNQDPDFLRGSQTGSTHRVGQKRPNAWGLYDMHGNVAEFCWDKYDDHYYDRSSGADPIGPIGPNERAFRGGCWSRLPHDCRSASRGSSGPGERSIPVGFRVARDQPGG